MSGNPSMVLPQAGSAPSDLRDWTFISLGSNFGESASILTQAMAALSDFNPDSSLRSSLWRSAPVDCPPGSPDFLNAVVGVRPHRQTTPESLLTELQQIERAFGRERGSVKHAPRSLDLDLLVFGSEQCATERLTLPHPRAHLRAFVLEPWNEIAPHLIVPGIGKSVRELLARLPSRQRVERVG